MKDINKRINSSKKKRLGNESRVGNSSKLIILDNSIKQQSKHSPLNFNQNNSLIFPKTTYIFNLSNKESRTSRNNNFASYYNSLTSYQSSKGLKLYNNKNYIPKKEVCKGNVNYSQKITFPTSSEIIQYFKLDNIFNDDFEFNFENKNYGQTLINKICKVREGDNYICSFFNFFNKKLKFNLGKKEFIIIKESYENHHNNKENETILLKVNIENISKNKINLLDENSYIFAIIKDIEKKKLRENHKSYKHSKRSKSFSKNFLHYHILDIKKNKFLDINNTKKTEEMQNKASLNILNTITYKNNRKKNNNNKDIIKEEKSSFFIPTEISKNLDLHLDKNEENNKQVSFQNKKETIKDSITEHIKINNIIINNKIKKINFNNKFDINYINIYIYINKIYFKCLNNMEFNCSNLNIYNNSSIEINFKNRYMNHSNKPQIFYLKIYNNGQIDFENIICNTKFNKLYNKSRNKNKNKFFQNYKQNKGKNMKRSAYFNKNNINSSHYFINNNKINKHRKNGKKKKKCKKLDNSFYMNKPLGFVGKNLNILGRDQGACRYLQNLLDTNPQETLHYLYKPICSNILQLINYPFGNYLIQKIIIYLNQEQLYEILKIISSYFLDICNNFYGTRVIQKIIDNLKTPKVRNYFYQLLKPNIIDLFKLLNGTFVVQKFSSMYLDYINEISEIIVKSSHILSTHRHGCCVIQKYLGLNDPYFVHKLIEKLLEKSLLLITDQFGNYVIQTILKKNNKHYGNNLAEKIADNFVYYAKHKYSSNVVRKCLDCCDGIYLSNLINIVKKSENLIELILDEHGNYIVQKVLMLSNPLIQKQMLKSLKPNLNKLKICNHADRVINRLLNNYPIING